MSVSSTRPNFLTDTNKGNFKLRKTQSTGDLPNDKERTFLDDITEGNFKLRRTKSTGDLPKSSDPLTKALQERRESMGMNEDDEE